MAKIAIVGCKRVQDQLCIASEKCLKAIKDNFGQDVVIGTHDY
jgi:hypothetical protein